MDKWITTHDAAQISGYHAEHIRRLIRSGEIEGQKFGHVWQVNRASLLEYVSRIEAHGEKRGPKVADD
ncbi:MAG: helix-turn-helix domain-containing protein [Chloroflexi bacterium]|nr:helix-turn-helix domain-containing protein [Chloroflexota bacterium]